MTPTVVDEAGFTVIGIEARTSNAREMTGAGVIAQQWARFVHENMAAQIPNKLDLSILAVYTDYAGDQDCEYTFVIGARVDSETKAPSGMVARRVPAGRYALFTSEKGPVEKIVIETWQRIWSVPKTAPGGDRAFQTDFEVYDQRAANPRDAQVDVYIGIR
jgi:predicted transcriptional regulator YdeE